MNWLWIGTSVTAVTTATTRCVLAKIRAASRRRTLEAALKDATPVERVAILRALRDWTKLE
ncbi:hypothetical protein ACIA5G_33595 [Amycolatopsis sp. NPDC051758]|uniref:hypothetical protein n=1 Tax=Amycolatopsis sp. NPDC051758 TaxID=3363935 RepID=UPI0037A8B075